MAILINLMAVRSSPTGEGTWQLDKTKVIAQVPLTFLNRSCKFLLHWMVEQQYLLEASLPKVMLDDTGDQMLILLRDTRQPLFVFDIKNTVVTPRSQYRSKVTPILHPDAFVKSKQATRV